MILAHFPDRIMALLASGQWLLDAVVLRTALPLPPFGGTRVVIDAPRHSAAAVHLPHAVRIFERQLPSVGRAFTAFQRL